MSWTDAAGLVNAPHPLTLGAGGVDVVKQLNLDRLSKAVNPSLVLGIPACSYDPKHSEPHR